MDTNVNVTQKIESLFSEIKQLSEQQVRDISAHESKCKDMVCQALEDYKEDVVKKQESLAARDAEIMDRLNEIGTEKNNLAVQLAAAVTSSDTTSPIEVKIDALNAEEYALQQKALLFKSVGIEVLGDESIFERVIKKFRDYDTSVETKRAEKDKLYCIFSELRTQLESLIRLVDTISYFPSYPASEVAILLRRHEPVDITGHKTGDHNNAIRRYLKARIDGIYDRGFEGTPAGDKLRELEGKPIFPENVEV